MISMLCLTGKSVFLCEHLDVGEGGEAGLFSVDSSDPPIFFGPLLEELFPDCEEILFSFFLTTICNEHR